MTLLMPRLENETLSDAIVLLVHEHVHVRGIYGIGSYGPMEIEEFASAVGAAVVSNRNKRLGVQPTVTTTQAQTPPQTQTQAQTQAAAPPPPPPPPRLAVVDIYRTAVDGISWAYGLAQSLVNPGQQILYAFKGIRCDQPNVVGMARWKRPDMNAFFYNWGENVPGWIGYGYEFCVSRVRLEGMEPIYLLQNGYDGSYMCLGEGCEPRGDTHTWNRRAFRGYTYP